jgi:hypothetical protein
VFGVECGEVGGEIMQVTQELSILESYTANEHVHRSAAWAAGRAASVKNCRFSVKQAQDWITKAGLADYLPNRKNPLMTCSMDDLHRAWRFELRQVALAYGVELTHGVAAKLINVYFKAAYVSLFANSEPWVNALHPPIDAVLLDALYQNNVGGFADFWKEAKSIRWSNFDSEQYEKVIEHIKLALGNRPLWQIEAFWRGHQ